MSVARELGRRGKERVMRARVRELGWLASVRFRLVLGVAGEWGCQMGK